ncbi:hypothetical protein psyc5s11_14620 [Clostridium gelidum]|uniref:Uncharacterized protein n=1 Tax=Clostridium gelidum TaxID=704125 RepID=A0ABM7T3H0_9CLOT|nr:hypothetical protein [Clostridium gelidum]BCZ45395.1 hypothetical protein psyc5s11_14620 [Clostridium gelidum]
MYSKIPITIAMMSIFLYLKIDGKYRIANRMNSILNINKKWKAYILSFIIFSIGIIFSLGIICSEYLRCDHIPKILNSVVAGIFFGISTCLSERIVSDVRVHIKSQ